MKKICILISSLGFVAASYAQYAQPKTKDEASAMKKDAASAQDDMSTKVTDAKASGIVVTPKVGAGIGFGSIDPSVTSSSIRFTWAAGVAGRYDFNSTWGVQLEALFVQKGVKFENKTTKGSASTTTTVSTNIKNIEYPLFLRADLNSLGLPIFGGLPVFGLVGGYFGLNVNATRTIDTLASIGSANLASSTVTDIKDSGLFKSTEFGLSLGLGTVIMNIAVEARFNLALTSANVLTATTAKNHTLMLMAGYQLNL